jgi:TRAP-type C4-dicarboxylate transport system permease small subunit
MNTLIKIGSFCEKVILVVAVIFMSIIPLAMGLQVLFRNLNIALNWSEEVARYSYVALAFLGSILCIRHGRHITVDFLFVKLPHLFKRVAGVLIHLCMAAFMVLCCYGSTLLISAATGVTSNSMGWFKLNYLYSLVFISCILMVIVCIIRAVEFALDKVKFTKDQAGEAI